MDVPRPGRDGVGGTGGPRRGPSDDARACDRVGPVGIAQRRAGAQPVSSEPVAVPHAAGHVPAHAVAPGHRPRPHPEHLQAPAPRRQRGVHSPELRVLRRAAGVGKDDRNHRGRGVARILARAVGPPGRRHEHHLSDHADQPGLPPAAVRVQPLSLAGPDRAPAAGGGASRLRRRAGEHRHLGRAELLRPALRPGPARHGPQQRDQHRHPARGGTHSGRAPFHRAELLRLAVCA